MNSENLVDIDSILSIFFITKHSKYFMCSDLYKSIHLVDKFLEFSLIKWIQVTYNKHLQIKRRKYTQNARNNGRVLSFMLTYNPTKTDIHCEYINKIFVLLNDILEHFIWIQDCIDVGDTKSKQEIYQSKLNAIQNAITLYTDINSNQSSVCKQEIYQSKLNAIQNAITLYTDINSNQSSVCI
jgi:hypothetical protein